MASMPGATPIRPSVEPSKPVVVPRAVYDKYRHMSFAEVAEVAERGEDGVHFATSEDGAIWLREGTKHDGPLQGKALVWFQGWI